MDVTIADVIVYAITFTALYIFIDFLAYTMRKISQFKVAEAEEQFHQQNLILRIDTVKHKEQEVYLVYDDERNKFVTQGTVAEEIADRLKIMYKDRNIFVKLPNDELMVFQKVV